MSINKPKLSDWVIEYYSFQQIFIGFWLYTFEVSSSKRKVDTYYVDLYEAVQFFYIYETGLSRLINLLCRVKTCWHFTNTSVYISLSCKLVFAKFETLIIEVLI